jgi:pimeloyl-ACP methyl ester carboxylesterase/1-acyl-sn-glycerol-3-phosphate acyltransferase
LDGTGLAAGAAFPGLARLYDIQCLALPADDRSSLAEILRLAAAHLDAELAHQPRTVHVLGESMGGLLALGLALRRPEAVKQLILVNPATSYQRSAWPNVAPLLPQLPFGSYDALPFAVAPLLGNPLRLAMQAVASAAAAATAGGVPPPPLLEAAAAAGTAALAQLARLGSLSEIIPPAALAHRLGILAAGCAFVNPRLREVVPPALVVVGDADLLLPSGAEGPRLAAALPRCTLRVMAGGSHALLQEGLDLPQLLRDVGALPVVPMPPPPPPAKRASRLALGAAARPSAAALARAREPLATLRRLVSPVFYSTTAAGAVVEGLDGLPDDTERPLLFVGNHQLFAPDLGLLIEELLVRRGTLLRGLAHPAVFAAGGTMGGAMGGPASSTGENTFRTFGAVPVSGRNLFELLSAKEAVLLFPGGVREAYKRRGEAYKLLWPSRPEFVRHALRTGATIVPFAAVGAEDGVSIVADADQLLATPFLGDALRSRAAAVPAARAVDTRATEQGEAAEVFLPPLVAPSGPPARFYFRFGMPRRCAGTADDPEAVAALYAAVRGDVEDGIEYLLRKRREDPFADLAPRMLFEAAAGRPAPSFRP